MTPAPRPGRASSSRSSAPRIDPAARVTELCDRRPPAARDREGARARVEGARPRRADRVAHARRERAPLRADPRDPRRRHRGRLHLAPPARGAGASPTGSPSCATARRAAPSQAADVSEGEILRLIIGRAVEQVFPEKRSGTSTDCAAPRGRGPERARFRDVGSAGRAGRDRRARRCRGQRPARVAARARRPPAGAAARCGSPAGRSTLGRAYAGARRAGVVHLPGDRHREGVMLSLSVRENVSLLTLAAARARRLRPAQARATAPSSGKIERARRPDAVGRDTGLVALGRQPAEGAVRARAARPSRRCCSPTSRRAASTPARASSSTRCCAEAADDGDGGRRALVRRGRAAGALRPRARVLARPVVRDARGRRDHRGEHHRRGDHASSRHRDEVTRRGCGRAPARAPLRRGRLPAERRARGDRPRPRGVHLGARTAAS